jgi:flap endonuclease-1
LDGVIEHLREKQADREEAVEEGKKKKGGVQIPEDWPWQRAKDLFLQPDVTPADSLEVGFYVTPIHTRINRSP